MKKYIIWLFALFVIVPHSTFAYMSFHGKDQLRIGQNIEENAYVAGGKVDITGNIAGDLVLAGGELRVQGNTRDNAIIAGGNIEINGSVGDDLIVAGGNIEINGRVSGDIRAAGGDVTLEQSASGDVNIAGGNIRVNSGVIIGRDLGIAGGDITLHGRVQGKADIAAGSLDLDGVVTQDVSLLLGETKKLHIGPNAKILGKLTYKSHERIPELEKIAVGGATYAGVSEFSPKKDVDTETLAGLLSGYMVYRFLFLVIMGTLFLHIFPHFTRKTAEIVKKSPGKSFLFGLLYLVLVPVIALFCFISIVGIPLGILSIAIYVFGFVFAKLITLVVMSNLVHIIWKERLSKSWHKWSIFVLIALVLTLVSGIDFIATLFAFGAILLLIGQNYSQKNGVSHD